MRRGTRRAVFRSLAALAMCLLAGCSDPLGQPLDLFHNLEGGQIAALRPPPPGVGMPYPELGTVPSKPVMPDPAYRRSLQAQLIAERDRTERVATDTPIETVPPPPGPPPAASASAQAASPTANATLDTAEAPAQPAAVGRPSAAAEAIAHAPPPKPAGNSPAGSSLAGTSAIDTSPAGAAPAGGTASSPAALAPPSPATGLTLVGAPPDESGLPAIPDAPPAPATFEGVSAEPAPTPSLLPARLPAPPAGTHVYFADASAVLPQSQEQALKDFVGHRAGKTVEILGLGDANSDTPEGQATAIALGLGRARAVADALAGMHVPQAAMRLGANAFGRGAVLRLLP